MEFVRPVVWISHFSGPSLWSLAAPWSFTGILDGYQGRQPNFHKWAWPAYEQGALPTLSLLSGEVSVRVLPGDKMYQPMAIEPHYMRPVILHGFGTTEEARTCEA